MFRELVVFLALTSVALAGLVLSPLETKPDKFKNVEGCYISDLDDVIPFGKSAPGKKYCQEYRCGSPYMEIASCGVASSGSSRCRVVEDHTKLYPGCCPKIACS